MEKIVLNAQERTETGKGPNRRLRAEGQIPAVLYGGEKEPRQLSLDKHDLDLALKQSHTMLHLNLDGAEQTVMLGEIQRDPTNYKLVHLDLMRVEAGHEVHAHVEVHGVGTPVGVREGALLERPVREVEVRCMPTDLPEIIEVDISHLGINQSIKAGDLPLGDKIHLVTDPDTLMFHVLVAKAAVEAPAEGEEAAGPELVGKKKEAGAEEAK